MAAMVQMASEPQSEQDVQATVTDFLDYTEHLPADIIRSLTLLRGLDETFAKNAYVVHQHTRQYGQLPKLPATSRPDPQTLRTVISTHLDQALSAREASYAEAVRLFDVADRHYNRLSSIVKKLHELPKPPSRDPTPAPSPEAKRSRSGRTLNDGTSAQRLTLNPPRVPEIAAHLLQKSRNRRITVPGDVLPPYNPDSPIASTEQSDLEAEPGSPTRHTSSKARKRLVSPNLKKPKIPKPPRTPHETTGPYQMPPPPPEDAKIGGEHRPWIRLTDWEMWKLRKKMKKNINWEPSEIMIRRELAEKDRGWENYYKAKADAQAKGTQFVDVDNLDKSQENGEMVRKGDTPTADVAAVRNRGMKLNEAKKLKREALAREQAALAAAEAEAAARRLGDIGSAFKNLFSPPGSALANLNRSASSPTANDGKSTGKKNNKKRKRDEGDVLPSSSAEASTTQKKKKQKTSPQKSPLSNGQTETTKIPLKINLPPPSSTLSSLSTPISPLPRTTSTRVTSIAAKAESTTPVLSRPSSRHSTRPSLGPISLPTRPSPRLSTPAHKPEPEPVAPSSPPSKAPPPQTAASRRPKREAPGQITQSSADGGAAVSISKRKNKPGPKPKQHTTTTTNTEKQIAALATDEPQIRIDIDGKTEVIDPDEERFCICGDVSWGEMICCEMDEKCEDGQWFHLSCVGMVELPARTVKWYSPACRKKYKRGEGSNGLVGRMVK